MLILAGIAVWGTLSNFGPFVADAPNKSLLLLQTFLAVIAVMTVPLASAVAERKRMEQKLQVMATSDPLTGLANLHKFVETLIQEIERSRRTMRPFAVCLLDMDGLKQINDREGHLAGNSALRRLAEVLRKNCRAMDTAARLGGDEFALILPETDERTALQVSSRLGEQTALEKGEPRLSVSIGVAVYPQHGTDLEALLRAADHRLYGHKRRRRARRSLPSKRRGSTPPGECAQRMTSLNAKG